VQALRSMGMPNQLGGAGPDEGGGIPGMTSSDDDFDMDGAFCKLLISASLAFC